MQLPTKTKVFSLIMTVMAFLLAPSWASAAVIYDESVNGDLAAGDPIVLNLVPGTNSVLGSAAYVGTTIDFDSFHISLGAGQTLQSVEYFVSNLSVSQDTGTLLTEYELRTGSHLGATYAGTTFEVLNPSPHALFAGSLPIAGPVSYAMTHTLLARSGNGGTWDYEIRFTVSQGAAVPEPSTCIILSGLSLCLGFAGRWRRGSRA